MVRVVCSALFALCSVARAQCEGWLAGHGLASIDGNVLAVTFWDSDGAGPEPERLIAGGSFIRAGGKTVNNLAAWDGNAWEPLGTGTNGAVWSLRVFEGRLIAGGVFTSAGGVMAVRIAAWDGAAWSAMANGMNDGVTVLAEHGGALIAGGTFPTTGSSGTSGDPERPAPDPSLQPRFGAVTVAAGEEAWESEVTRGACGLWAGGTGTGRRGAEGAGQVMGRAVS